MSVTKKWGKPCVFCSLRASEASVTHYSLIHFANFLQPTTPIEALKGAVIDPKNNINTMAPTTDNTTTTQPHLIKVQLPNVKYTDGTS
ncbi:unnamed protein product [Rhizopus stolonifer]